MGSQKRRIWFAYPQQTFLTVLRISSHGQFTGLRSSLNSGPAHTPATIGGGTSWPSWQAIARSMQSLSKENGVPVRRRCVESEIGTILGIDRLFRRRGCHWARSMQKLYSDFVAYHKAAMAHPSKDFRQSYTDWEKALKLASKNGALEFH